MRVRRTITAILALSLGLAACSSGNGGEGGDATGATSAAGEPAGGEGTDDAGTVEGQGLNDPLVIGVRQVGEVFDPSTQLPTEISAVAANIYNWMWDRAPDGELAPGLVEEWALSEDGLTLDLVLREGVTFHSGDDFTAEDIEFSWSRHAEANLADRVARSLERFEIEGPHELTIHFGSVENGFLAQQGIPIVSKAYHERVGEDEFKQRPVGTGPYQFIDLRPGESIRLERYEDYWGEAPDVEDVEMRFLTEDTTRVSQLQTGEADMIMQVPYGSVEQLQQAEGIDLVEQVPGSVTVFLAMKTDDASSPWADPKVREAITLAIDHDAIVDDVLHGIPTHHPVLAPDDLGYSPALEPHSYDPERAKQLLDEAGYGEGLEFELPYIAGALTGVSETAEAISLYLEQVGIRATPQPLEGPNFIQFVMQASKNPDMDYVALFLGAMAGKPEPTLGMVTQFSSVTPFSWYNDDQVNGMVLQAAGTADADQRAEAIARIGAVVHEQRRFYAMWTATNVYGMKSCIDFTPTRGDMELLLIKDVDTSGC